MYKRQHVGNSNLRSSSNFGSVVFDGEIVGIFFDQEYTRGSNIDGVQYHSSSFIYDMRSGSNAHTINRSDNDGGRLLENPNFYNYNRTSDSTDWVSVGNYNGTNDYLRFGWDNGNNSTGDYIRVIVKQSTNNAPTASNGTVYINENNQESTAGDRTPSNITKVFTAGDFNYSDSDSDPLSKIKITTLESAGTLEYSNGSSWSDVTLNQEITASDIGNNRLRFTPAANSESNPTFGFKVHDGTEYSSSAYTLSLIHISEPTRRS